jgi:hypothetical protein
VETTGAVPTLDELEQSGAQTARVGQGRASMCSVLRVANQLSDTALKQSPLRLSERLTPNSSARRANSSLVYCPDSPCQRGR